REVSDDRRAGSRENPVVRRRLSGPRSRIGRVTSRSPPRLGRGTQELLDHVPPHARRDGLDRLDLRQTDRRASALAPTWPAAMPPYKSVLRYLPVNRFLQVRSCVIVEARVRQSLRPFASLRLCVK